MWVLQFFARMRHKIIKEDDYIADDLEEPP
jgi:hypothetical protein